jgi:putative addiction module killer protein
MEVIHYITEKGVDRYQSWFDGLSDKKAKASIFRRIDRIGSGNFGDHEFLRDGVYELRIDVGQGYRVYYFQYTLELVVLLCGGNKKSQSRDIKRAITYRNDFLARS